MRELLNLQLMMFLLMIIGLVLRKLNIITAEGKKCLTDLVINIILPANIIKSFIIEFNQRILLNFLAIFLISIGIQVFCTILSNVLYKKQERGRRKVLQYGIICSNAGFLGNPIAEGVFGSMGLSLASVYLIPQRIVMWSAGISYFTQSPDRKTLVKKVVTHPCIVAVVIGILIMLTQVSLPEPVVETISSLSSCCTAVSMIVIGTILSEVDIRSMIDKTVFSYTILRLVLIPLSVYLVCRMLPVEPLITGVSTLLAAMPCGATTAILATKYDGDDIFATKCVVFSTVASLATTFLWSIILL
ncbi:MAG: AEC family transporter [Lachnospiraceae bacterium]|nr:AEC family transporter [Lachnospiraceae bacterium]